MREQLGQVIKYHRTNRNLSQVELAEFIGVTNSFISLIECGAREPSLDTLFRIGYAIGIPAGLLLIQAVPDTGCLNYKKEARELLKTIVPLVKRL